MLDYSLFATYKNHKYGDFICNYFIDNDEIVLLNNDKEFARVPYTDENEKDILYIMKKQVKTISMAKNYLHDNIDKQNIRTKIYMLMSFLFIILSITAFLKKNYVTGLPLAIVSILDDLVAMYNNLKLQGYENILDDLEKNELFLQYETEINRFIKDINNLECFNGFEKININDIHFLDYEDVEHLVEASLDYQIKVK